MSQNLKDTLNLPVTNFPMRGNLAKREPERVAYWESNDLYSKRLEKNKDSKLFTLHDGPPFTNGDVHIGTALNKILKDTILRYKNMRGFHSAYIPGWDCHGLPIEHKVARELKEKGEDLTPLEIRQSCAEFSKSYIEVQRKQFKRLGVLADWEREYRTMKPEYEATILRTFGRFVEKDLVYRSKKPVYWSIPCATALAEAEVEYQEHTSPSIYVAFPLSDNGKLPVESAKVSVVIWTTTPWTLPANMAVAVHPRFDYTEVKVGDQGYIVASDLAETFIEACGFEGATLGNSFKGSELAGIEARHPFIDRPSPIIEAEYVTAESGTGCVHTAPGHGLDDYISGLNHNLEIYCPLTDEGTYVDDGQIPEGLVGVSVLETKGKCPANIEVLRIIGSNGSLLAKKNIKHQYPHCWRSKTPVIFRAMDQWFVSLDKANVREGAIKAIDDVKWVPDWGINRIKGSVTSRPDWCISRQRSWGVPIPVFFDEDKNPLLDTGVINQIADLVEKEGTDIWYSYTAEDFKAKLDLPDEWKDKTLIVGRDTLDVWIDSGCSHRAVLQKEEGVQWPADLYLEGSDQHRGWFQSSLWTAMIADEQPPYKSIVTHGFIVGQDGKKISKSDGKPQTADRFVQQYGADVVRLWIASEDYRNDVPLSDEIFKHIMQSYRTLRNTFRFQIGTLSDFDINKDGVAKEDLTAIDQWALQKVDELIGSVTEAYENYEFHKVYQLCSRFFGVTLSATYHDVLKDRLYTYAPNDPARRSSQTAIHRIFSVLTRLLAPVLPFTTDEAWAYFTEDADFTEDLIYLQSWPEKDDSYYCETTCKEIDLILEFKQKKVNEPLEALRKEKVIGQSLDAQVIIEGSEEDEVYQALQKHRSILEEIFIVSTVTCSVGGKSEIVVETKHADGVRCPRSWRWVPELSDTEKWGPVSPRCKEALLQRETTISQ